MRSALNLITAYLAVIFLVLLCIIYLLRLVARRYDIDWCKRMDRALRRVHTPLCYAFYAVGFAHGVLSSVRIFSFNVGSICYFASLLLWAGHALRKKLPLSFLRPHRILCALCLCLTVWHLLASAPFLMPRLVKSWFVTMPTEPLINGVYRAEATGYRKHLWVEVTISGWRIEKVEVIEHYENGREYYEEPIEVIPQRIVEQQTTNVDVIAGATKTSLGIMEATRLALMQAIP